MAGQRACQQQQEGAKRAFAARLAAMHAEPAQGILKRWFQDDVAKNNEDFWESANNTARRQAILPRVLLDAPCY